MVARIIWISYSYQHLIVTKYDLRKEVKNKRYSSLSHAEI